MRATLGKAEVPDLNDQLESSWTGLLPALDHLFPLLDGEAA
jgi:hypothetical protein